MASTASPASLSLRMRSGGRRDKKSRSEPHLEQAEDIKHDLATVDGVDAQPAFAPPTLAHRFRHDSSILCLTATHDSIIAGSQSGQILVFALDTFERSRVVDAHQGSVLGLCLSHDRRLLFSSGSDRLVGVWDAATFKQTAVLYSQYDVGDIFCVSYAPRSRTVYMGCQNTSILWCDLKDSAARGVQTQNGHPAFREDPFFDSFGPGGLRYPRQEADSRSPLRTAERALEIPKDNIHQFAHFGYIYCMLMTAGNNANVPAEEILVTGGGDGAACLWTMDDHDGGRVKLVARLEDERDDPESVLSLVLDNTLLFCGHTGGEVRVWDLEARQLVRVLNHTDSDILSLSIRPQALFAVCADGETKQFDQRFDCVGSWKAHDGRALASMCVRAPGHTFFLTGGNDDSVAVWDVQDQTTSPALHAQKSEDALIKSLRDFVSYRTVSGDERHSTACRRGASWLRSLFKSLGASTELLSTDEGCNPIVFAKFRGEVTDAKPKNRVLFYGHYDVIAADDKHRKWICDPFSMTGLDGYVYGRGVTDNKGPIMAALYAVSDLVAKRKLASDVVFIIEGEEECGSRMFKETIRQHKALIGAVDWILLANSYWLDDETPCLTYGLRGVIHATVEVESDQPDLHSGVDGSRLLDEPLKDLIGLLARLSGPRGAIEIPGFHDAILPVSRAEVALYDDIARSLLARDPSLGTPASLAASLMQRWRDASLTVHGFKTSGSEKSTIIPHYASAALSIRLVPSQDSATISRSLVAFLRSEFAKMQSENALRVNISHQAEPWLGDPSNAIFKALRRAVADVWRGPARPDSAAGAPLSPLSPTQRASRPPRRPSSNAGGRAPALATSSTLASSSSGGGAPLDGTAVAADGEGECVAAAAPLLIREGGSIPAIRFLETEFGAPAANLPCGQASDNAHLDNERLRVVNLLNAREIFRRVFLDLMAA